MNTEQQHILFVEDDRGISMLYGDVLENVGFKTGSHFDYELDDVIAHFAYTREEARKLIQARPYTAVLLDHTLDENRTTEGLVPELLRRNPHCTILLTSSKPDEQRQLVTDVLKDEGLERHIPQLKTHTKSNISGLTNFLNDIIRPPSLAPNAIPHAHAKCSS